MKGAVMAGNTIGGAKMAAGRIGVSHAEYETRLAAGDKWCRGCKGWHSASAFTTDRSRPSGLSSSCAAHRSANPRPRYAEPIAKRRARRLVQMRVRRGSMPHPNDVPCADCGRARVVDGPRHEYDHYAGYEGDAAGMVQSVCKDCHAERGRQRGEFRKV